MESPRRRLRPAAAFATAKSSREPHSLTRRSNVPEWWHLHSCHICVEKSSNHTGSSRCGSKWFGPDLRWKFPCKGNWMKSLLWRKVGNRFGREGREYTQTRRFCVELCASWSEYQPLPTAENLLHLPNGSERDQDMHVAEGHQPRRCSTISKRPSSRICTRVSSD